MANLSLNDVETIFSDLRDIQVVKPGGQKKVFSAKNSKNEEIILKILHDITDTNRLDREIEAVRLMNSSNIPKIFEKGTKNFNSEDYFFVLEEKVSGEDLKKFLSLGKKFSIKEAVNFLETLLGLAVEMEKLGIVHRDINPNNIIMDNNGKFWLIDFGISRHLGLVSITDTNQNFGPGTPGYSPPEQIRNLKKNIDSRADLFGIGVTLHELLSGCNPLTTGAQNALEVFQRTETIMFPNLVITGDTQNQLAGFIGTLTDKFLSRRPRNASEAFSWFQTIKPTLIIN